MSLHKIFLHFHNEFQSMYQLLFSFRLASSDGLFIVNVVKSRSILGKSLCCNTTKSIRDIRTIYVVNLNLVTIRNNMRNTHILTYTTSCVSNARSNRKKIFFQIISTSFIFAMLVFSFEHGNFWTHENSGNET